MRKVVPTIWYREIFGERYDIMLISLPSDLNKVTAVLYDLKDGCRSGFVCFLKLKNDEIRCSVKLNKSDPEKTIRWIVARIKKSHLKLPALPFPDDICPECYKQKIPLMMACPHCECEYELLKPRFPEIK